ncbi:hypothetical protein LguiB_030683 [Lonicera macranthoides]
MPHQLLPPPPPTGALAAIIAPIIHEWTYDAMCHDLLSMEGNKYVHKVQSKIGCLPEKKEVLLKDHDPVWLELCHAHIADASERLHIKMTSFMPNNKAAQIHHGSSQLATLFFYCLLNKNMIMMRPLTILVTIMALVFLLSIKPLEACRVLAGEKEEWMNKKANNILLLPYLQAGVVRPPGNGCTSTPGQGGNPCRKTIEEKGFASRVRVSPPSVHATPIMHVVAV